MKVKKGFVLRTICNEHIIVAEGKENIDFNNIISMNETATHIWNSVKDLEMFTVSDMVESILSEYEVDEQIARTDCENLAKQWLSAGIISE